MRELSPLFGMGVLRVGTYYHYTPTSHTRDTVRRGSSILLPFLPAEHKCCLTAAILDFAKGAFFEANRGKNYTLYLYLPELLICVKGITEVVFYFVFSFTVKEGSKKGLKKEQRPIANRQLLYQSSLLPHFLPQGATVTIRLVVRGFQDKDVGNIRNDSPTCSKEGLCIALAIMASNHWMCQSMDIKTTFLLN